jgi:hypothetical protein
MKMLFFLFFSLVSPSLDRAKVLISILRRTFQLLVKLSCQIINLETVCASIVNLKKEEKSPKNASSLNYPKRKNQS